MDERCCLHYVCFTGQLLFLSEGSSWMNVVVCIVCFTGQLLFLSEGSSWMNIVVCIMCVLQDNCCFCQRVVVG